MKEKLLFLLFLGALVAAGLYFAWRVRPAPAALTVVEEKKTPLILRLTQAAGEPFIPWTGPGQHSVIIEATPAASCPPGTSFFTSAPAKCLVNGTLVPVVPDSGSQLILPIPSAEP